MSLWEELATTALVGTERQSPTVPPAGNAIGDALAGVEGRDPQSVLLSLAAAAALYRRAGQRAGASRLTPPAPAEADTLPLCSTLAARHLEWMLANKHREVIPEWLAAVRARGQRVPEHLLPDLLQAGRQSRDLREPIAAVAGRRGAWLAAQNPEWAYLAGWEDPQEAASAAETSEVWETGNTAARELFLARVRESDPARAREMLAVVWSQETADARSKFLATFRRNLSPEDEPFLEPLLDDRSKQVRDTTADLLARLPGSALVQRMTERVDPLVSVQWKGGVLGIGRHLEVEVTLPDACDKAAVRDGIEPKLPTYMKTLGEKAWWLRQMLAAIPPQHWCEKGSATPDQLLDALKESEWKELFQYAWSIAAARSRDVAWAEALLLRFAGYEITQELFELLPEERRDGLVLGLLKRVEGTVDGNHPALALLIAHQRPWSRELANAVLDRLRTQTQATQYDWQLMHHIPRFGLHIPPELAEEAATGWQDWASGSYWRTPVENLVAVLQFRRDMLEEIKR